MQEVIVEVFTYQIIMEFKNTLEIVTKDIQDIEKLVSNFKNYSRIPNIELDLALSRLRNVYDLLLLFREDGEGREQKAESEREQDAERVRERVREKEQEAERERERVRVREREQEAERERERERERARQAEEIASSRAPSAEKVDEESQKEVKEPVIPAAEKKSAGDIKFINEKLAEQSNKKDVSSKIQNQAIKSIAGSIGINDKFFFIRELFAGNAESFRTTMDDLDMARNFNEAHSYLMEKFQWDMDSEAVQLLLNLVRRKFITSGNE